MSNALHDSCSKLKEKEILYPLRLETSLSMIKVRSTLVHILKGIQVKASGAGSLENLGQSSLAFYSPGSSSIQFKTLSS